MLAVSGGVVLGAKPGAAAGKIRALKITPASMSFGKVAAGTISRSKAISIANPNAESIGIGPISITGDFAQSNDCGAQLSAHGSCTISVTFNSGVSAASVIKESAKASKEPTSNDTYDS
jgi:hypothetical protein